MLGNERHVHYEEEDEDVWEYIFCFYFNGEAGVVILTFAGMTLMIITLITNIYSGSNDPSKSVKTVQFCLLSLFIIVMCCGYLTGMAAVYEGKSKYSRCGAFLISLGTLFYILFTLLSIMPNANLRRTVCIDNRCPDHHWLVDGQWRAVVYGSTSDARMLFIIVSFINTCLVLSFFIYTVVTFMGYGSYMEQFEYY